MQECNHAETERGSGNKKSYSIGSAQQSSQEFRQIQGPLTHPVPYYSEYLTISRTSQIDTLLDLCAQ
jgi:hypothetical protein